MRSFDPGSPRFRDSWHLERAKEVIHLADSRFGAGNLPPGDWRPGDVAALAAAHATIAIADLLELQDRNR